MRWLPLLLILSSCAPRMRYPGPLDGFAGYGGQAPAPDVAPVPPSTDVAVTPASAPAPRTIDEAMGRRRRPARPDATAQQVVRASVSLLDRTRLVVDGDVYRHDCIGMVEAAYATVGVDLTSDISLLYEQAKVLGVFHRDLYPLPGDVVFFDNSYDKNRNGVRDDPNTHVAVVEKVDDDGTITMVHLGGRGKPVTRKLMNVRYPDQTRSPDGKVWNSHLRSTRDRDGGPTLTSQLWTGFGSFWMVSEDQLADAAQVIRERDADGG